MFETNLNKYRYGLPSEHEYSASELNMKRVDIGAMSSLQIFPLKGAAHPLEGLPSP